MKKILFLSEIVKGGAEKSLINEARRLKAKGHAVRYLMFNLPISRYIYAPFMPYSLPDVSKDIRKVIAKWQPDEIRSYHLLGILGYKLAKKYDIDFTYYLRDETNLGIFDIRWMGTAKYLFYKYILKLYNYQQARAVKGAVKVIANSKFMARLCKERYGVPPTVRYPIVLKREVYVKDRAPEYIGMIGDEPHKGIDIFLAVAKELKVQKFALAGHNAPKNLPPNVTHLGFVDPKEIYARLKLLLIPSQWHEAYGRVSIEAQMNDIPVLASHIGGLPETGCQTVKDYTNPKAWIKAIDKIL